VSFSERLKIALKGESVNSFAKKCGLSESLIRKYLDASSVPSVDKVVKMAEIANVPLEWLAAGKEMNPRQSLALDDREQEILLHHPSARDLAYIPLVDVTASAGHGALVLSETESSVIAFQREYLRTVWFVNPDELFCMPVQGESMEPTIQSGEFLLVSRGERHIKPSDGIFVVRLEGNILVKRLQPLPGSRIKISSDNPAYEPYIIELSDGIDFDILGKVMLVNGLRRV